MPKKMTESEWLASVFSKINANSIEDCWEWTGGLTSIGYASCDSNRGSSLLHRALFLILFGDLARDVCVLHRCDNRKCLNPFHWFTGTQADNVADAVKKGRQPRAPGERQWNHILTDELVLEMRRLRRELKSISEIARQFGLSQATAAQAMNGHSWKHLPGAVKDVRLKTGPKKRKSAV